MPSRFLFWVLCRGVHRTPAPTIHIYISLTYMKYSYIIIYYGDIIFGGQIWESFQLKESLRLLRLLLCV